MPDEQKRTEYQVSLELRTRSRDRALHLLDLAYTTSREITTAHPGIEPTVSLTEYQTTDVQPLVHAAVVEEVANRVLAALHQDDTDTEEPSRA